MKKFVLLIIAVIMCVSFVIPVMATEMGEINIGDTVTFGVYEQDNNLDNGKEPIEWEVLDIQDGKALLLSIYALDCVPYNNYSVEESIYYDRETYQGDGHEFATTWETCTLRAWLNEDFLNEAFNDSEAAMIVETTVINNDYYMAGLETPASEGGNDTQDKVYLLNIEEINKYYGIDLIDDVDTESVICQVTDYGKEHCIQNWAEMSNEPIESRAEWYQSKEEKAFGKNWCYWWLRSSGYGNSCAIYINSKGRYNDMGAVFESYVAVRPAIWINIE